MNLSLETTRDLLTRTDLKTEPPDAEVTFVARLTASQLADLAIRNPELLPYIRFNQPIPISPEMLRGVKV